MKTKSIRNNEASHRFIRQYMAANDIADLNLAKMGQTEWEQNHGHGQRASALARSMCHIPVDLRGDKPRSPQGGLTFQPFDLALAGEFIGVEKTKAFFEERGLSYPK